MTETMVAPSTPAHCLGDETDGIDWKKAYYVVADDNAHLQREYKRALREAQRLEAALADATASDEVRVLKVFKFTDVAAMQQLRVFVEALEAVGLRPIVRGHQQRDTVDGDAEWRGPLVGLEVAVDERARVARTAPMAEG